MPSTAPYWGGALGASIGCRGLQIESTNAQFPAGFPAGTLFHPLFLYKIIWNLIGVAVILFAGRRFQLQWGRLFGVSLIWYSLGRSWPEVIGIDPSSNAFFGVPANIWASFVALALGIVLIVVQGRRHPTPEPALYREGRVPKNTPSEQRKKTDRESDSDPSHRNLVVSRSRPDSSPPRP